MMPRVLPVDDPGIDLALLEALETSQVIIFPTETVYGIGGNPWDELILDRVRSLKERGSDQPFTLHLADVSSIDKYAHLDAATSRQVEQLLPGPYTLLLPARPEAPPSAVRHGVVGIRVPDHPLFSGAISRLQRALFGTSVNRSGQPPLSDIDRIIQEFGHVDLIVTGSVRGCPSSILDLTSTPVRVLRGSLPPSLNPDTEPL